MGWQNPAQFFLPDSSDGRNGAGSPPQNTVATVASVALYLITSTIGASYHISQPDTPSCMLGFVFVLHLMFFQQAGIHIQMLRYVVHCHIQLEGFGKLCPAPSHSRFASDTIFATASAPVAEAASKAHSLNDREAIPNAPGLYLDTAADPADPVH